MKKSILITGASGFIGSFLVEEALKQGFTTWAGVRGSSSLNYLQDKRINLIKLDFRSIDALSTQLGRHVEKHGKWDVIIHCAGVTKCNDSRDFDRFNYQATVNLIAALREQGMRPEQFVYISSLSIFGPIREKPVGDDGNGLLYRPITEKDEPKPNTAYGRSKVRTERYIKSLVDYPYLIYRPTGVYGPRERDYFLMAKSIKQHVDFAVGYKKQEITFVYVKDLVQAIFLGIEKGVTRREYFVSDGRVYESATFSDLLRKELGNPWMVRIKAPLWLLKIICVAGGFLGKITHKPIALNPDKYSIMKQRNWQCDIQPLMDELGYQPQYPLERGVKEAVAWYKENKWI
ncbi:MAG: NAD(P)-dependent oxidoreductase [Bacteroidaceae bacterium]|nr:NAD(P)-dependent oxidoreductase [Bacteroidaceae bacterium]